ncbi:hypothetical protein RFI_33845, partial [Reticulomyxa filosa]
KHQHNKDKKNEKEEKEQEKKQKTSSDDDKCLQRKAKEYKINIISSKPNENCDDNNGDSVVSSSNVSNEKNCNIKELNKQDKIYIFYESKSDNTSVYVIGRSNDSTKVYFSTNLKKQNVIHKNNKSKVALISFLFFVRKQRFETYC